MLHAWMYQPEAAQAKPRNERGVHHLPSTTAALDIAIVTAAPHSSSFSSSSSPPAHGGSTSTASSAIQSLTSASTLDSKLDLPSVEAAARKGLLREPVFDEWKNDAATMDLESPEEMQRKDPLGTQMWKLYHKQKTQIPNSERLENLTWRLMSMNLRRRELERQG